MMLRSSSTPVLGSLLSSISSESPTTNHHHDTTPTPPVQKLSFHHALSPGSQHFTTLSCTSPISPSVSNGVIRRVQSEGNLESLMNSSSNLGDDYSFFTPPKKFSRKLHSSLLETIPSFSFHNSRNRLEDNEDEEQEDEDDGFHEFQGFEMENKVVGLIEQMGYVNLVIKEDAGEGSAQMYLEKGIWDDTELGGGSGGATGAGGGGNFSQVPRGGGNGSGDHRDVEEHYKKMVNENPGNPLFLRNYAEFLHQSKKDPQGAEEYYSRAILIDPNDGEILSQYAKILWELHRDKERVTGYFERAVQASSEDSHVHAAYASFLWEIEEEEDKDDDNEGYYSNITPLFNNGTLASATA